MDRLQATREELIELGVAARERLPFETFGTFASVHRDANALIEAQNASRLQHLLPLRTERMSASEFAFYRGTAVVMAHDLAAQPSTGVDLVICGDAHMSNFGLFASPERKLVFDLNDFDEAAVGPWEWDIRRLVASTILGARSLNFAPEDVTKIAERTAESYRRNLNEFLSQPAYDRLFIVRDEEQASDFAKREHAFGIFWKAAKKAKKRTREKAAKKLLRTDEQGLSRFVEDPPILTRQPPENADVLEALYRQYLTSARPDVGLLLSTFSLTDVALRVVGVGSVGTRCYLLSLTGPDGEHLILQIKEAQQSVVSQFHEHPDGKVNLLPSHAPEGKRVVTYQQVLQTASDPFLGFVESDQHHFYVRQFRDKKGSIEIEGMHRDEFDLYSRACAMLLARAHSQSPLAHAVQGYLGDTPEADCAIARWSLSYADQARLDYRAFLTAQHL